MAFSYRNMMHTRLDFSSESTSTYKTRVFDRLPRTSNNSIMKINFKNTAASKKFASGILHHSAKK